MRERSQLLLGQSVRITWQLGDGKQPAWSQRISDICQTPLGISHVAEDSHEERNIEGAGTKRQLDGIRVNVPTFSRLALRRRPRAFRSISI